MQYTDSSLPSFLPAFFKSFGSVVGYKHVETAPSITESTICFPFTQSASRLDDLQKVVVSLNAKFFSKY